MKARRFKEPRRSNRPRWPDRSPRSSLDRGRFSRRSRTRALPRCTSTWQLPVSFGMTKYFVQSPRRRSRRKARHALASDVRREEVERSDRSSRRRRSLARRNADPRTRGASNRNRRDDQKHPASAAGRGHARLVAYVVAMTPRRLLAQLLRPAGGGVYVVSTGRGRAARAARAALRRAGDDAVRARLRERARAHRRRARRHAGRALRRRRRLPARREPRARKRSARRCLGPPRRRGPRASSTWATCSWSRSSSTTTCSRTAEAAPRKTRCTRTSPSPSGARSRSRRSR